MLKVTKKTFPNSLGNPWSQRTVIPLVLLAFSPPLPNHSLAPVFLLFFSLPTLLSFPPYPKHEDFEVLPDL